MPDTPTVFITLYRTPRGVLPRPQRWRWRASNAGNARILANSADAYTNRQDALDAIGQLFGNASNIVLRQPGNASIIMRRADA